MPLAQNAPFEDMLNVRKIVMSKPEIVYANIQEGTSTFSTTDTKTTYIAVQAFLVDDDITNEVVARNIGNTIISNYTGAETKDIIQVTLTYGYDIGIWSFWRNYNHKFTPNNLN